MPTRAATLVHYCQMPVNPPLGVVQKDKAEMVSDFALYLLRQSMGRSLEIKTVNGLTLYIDQPPSYLICEILYGFIALTIGLPLTLLGMFALLFSVTHSQKHRQFIQSENLRQPGVVLKQDLLNRSDADKKQLLTAELVSVQTRLGFLLNGSIAWEDSPLPQLLAEVLAQHNIHPNGLEAVVQACNPEILGKLITACSGNGPLFENAMETASKKGKKIVFAQPLEPLKLLLKTKLEGQRPVFISLIDRYQSMSDFLLQGMVETPDNFLLVSLATILTEADDQAGHRLTQAVLAASPQTLQKLVYLLIERNEEVTLLRLLGCMQAQKRQMELPTVFQDSDILAIVSLLSRLQWKGFLSLFTNSSQERLVQNRKLFADKIALPQFAAFQNQLKKLAEDPQEEAEFLQETLLRQALGSLMSAEEKKLELRNALEEGVAIIRMLNGKVYFPEEIVPHFLEVLQENPPLCAQILPVCSDILILKMARGCVTNIDRGVWLYTALAQHTLGKEKLFLEEVAMVLRRKEEAQMENAIELLLRVGTMVRELSPNARPLTELTTEIFQEALQASGDDFQELLTTERFARYRPICNALIAHFKLDKRPAALQISEGVLI
jgi:hypothetical protein